MSENTKIEWCDHTFNPWYGCQAVSPACEHCYAEAWAKRAGKDFATRTRTTPANWKEPLRWNAQADTFQKEHGRRQRVFTLSLGDWADNQAPIEWLVDLLELIRTTPRLDWLMLTKRIGIAVSRLQQAHTYVLEHWPAVDAQPLSWWLTEWIEECNPPRNVWIGATVVNQAEADRDIPKLLDVPAAKRFLSMEPLLGPVDLHLQSEQPCTRCVSWNCELHGKPDDAPCLRRVDWVIVGGESGPGARPMHPDWARSLRDQCKAAGVPFLFKQWGDWAKAGASPFHAYAISPTGAKRLCEGTHAMCEALMVKVGKKAAGRTLDGRTWDGMPQQ